MRYIFKYGRGVIDRIQKNLIQNGKTEKEAIDMIHRRMNLFVELLKENIHFEKRD